MAEAAGAKGPITQNFLFLKGGYSMTHLDFKDAVTPDGAILGEFNEKIAIQVRPDSDYTACEVCFRVGVPVFEIDSGDWKYSSRCICSSCLSNMAKLLDS